MSYTIKDLEDRHQDEKEKLEGELSLAEERMLTSANNYKQHIFRLETDLNKKEKEIRFQKETINTLRYETDSLRRKLDIVVNQNDQSEMKLRDRME